MFAVHLFLTRKKETMTSNSALGRALSHVRRDGVSAAEDGSRFKCENSFVARNAEAERIKSKYPDRVPIIVEKSLRSSVPDIDKKKYLVPFDLTVGQFVYVIRKRIRMRPEDAIFVFVKNVLPPTASTLSQMYDDYHDEDGFLYITYSSENTFGALSRSIR